MQENESYQTNGKMKQLVHISITKFKLEEGKRHDALIERVFAKLSDSIEQGSTRMNVWMNTQDTFRILPDLGKNIEILN